MAKTRDCRVSLRDYGSGARRNISHRKWLLWILSDVPVTAGLAVSEVAPKFSGLISLDDAAGLMLPAEPIGSALETARLSNVDVRMPASAKKTPEGQKSRSWALVLRNPYLSGEECTTREAAESLRAWAKDMEGRLRAARAGKGDGFYEEGDLPGNCGLVPLSVLRMDKRLKPAKAASVLLMSGGTYTLMSENYGPRREHDLRGMLEGGD